MNYAHLRSTPATVVVSLLTMLGACDEWPRHAHIPADSTLSLPAGTSAAQAIDIHWTDLGQEVEPNDTPASGRVQGVGDGWTLAGELTGVGWDHEYTPDPVLACGELVAFPPTAAGNYMGDVDWFSFLTDDDATLCLGVALEGADISFDLTVYLLNECDEPTKVFIDPATDEPMGLARTGGHATHVLNVREGSTIGIALAGYWPNNTDRSSAWQLTGALVPLVAGAGGDLCPPDVEAP